MDGWVGESLRTGRDSETARRPRGDLHRGRLLLVSPGSIIPSSHQAEAASTGVGLTESVTAEAAGRDLAKVMDKPTSTALVMDSV